MIYGSGEITEKLCGLSNSNGNIRKQKKMIMQKRTLNSAWVCIRMHYIAVNKADRVQKMQGLLINGLRCK